MKAWSAPSARRISTIAVAGLSALTLISGCGFGTRQQAAAVVNGEVITMADVAETSGQLKEAKLEFPEDVVVTALIAAPLLEGVVEESGSWQPDETYASALAEIPDATETTKDFVAAVALIQSQRMTEADVAAYRADLEAADISVNPKFGEVVLSDEGPVYFTVGQVQPNWIETPATGATTPAPAG